MVTVRTWGVAWTIVVVACADAGDSTDPSESSSGPTGLECVAPSEPDLTLVIEPESFPSPQMHLQASCTVSEVDDGDPKRLVLQCMAGSTPVEWRMSASGLQLPFPSHLVVDSQVELSYFASLQDGVSLERSRWVVLRPSADEAPSFIAASTVGGMPPTDGTPAIDVVGDTTCESELGSCGIGETRRAALRFSLEDVGETVVFDHDEGELAHLRMQVGDAIWDDGNCEGFSANWYELAVVRDDVDGADG